MLQTLHKFTSDGLFGATSALLAKLNIEFDRETAEAINVAEFYDGPMPLYLSDALQSIEHTYFIGIVNDQSLAGEKAADSLDDVAETVCHGGKYDGMFVFACDAKADANLTRSAASALTRAFNRIASANPVILIIRQGSLLSLATCERMNYTQEWRRGQGEKLGKVTILRNINCVNPHRGHVDILETLGDKRYPSFEDLYKHWMEVFSSELLTKKFYNELSDWYAWAVMVAKFPNDIRTEEDDAKYNHESCIRLITRLIFVWFLKQKHLIPEEFFDEAYIRENLIDNFDPHDKQSLYYNAGESKYYRLILQNLFFAMLNCPIVAEGGSTPNNRRFRGDHQHGYKRDGYNVNNMMRYKAEFSEGGAEVFIKLANRNVPFLNGGLFDCLDDKPKGLYYDGFSERQESLDQLYLPDYLFFGEEVGNGIDLSQWYDDKKKKNVSARGLIDILKRYSFTIEENTPYDQEVSLDPELLGKVFENLLAAYNPETKQSARKQTGSFYTPREIVQYMVDESLVAHLKRMCGDEMEPQYRQLLNYAADNVALTDDQRKSIMNAIYNCRVLDPACGSGAFPMGVLQQMVHVLKRIDPSNKMWETMMVDIAIAEAKKELQKVTSGNEAEKAKIEENRKARLDDIENAFNQSINDPDYARKLYLIEHCIYGVDIQPIATQISKLRFFISLVVDQKPTKDAKSNFGIRPLPNLEAKFVTANTLIPLDRTKNLFTNTDDIRYYEEQLQDINHRIFLAKKNTVKKELQQLMFSTRAAMAQTMENLGAIGTKGYNQLMEWNMFDQNASASFFDPEWMFGVKGGFDVVIGNPPYVVTKRGQYSGYLWDTDLYKMFFEAAFKRFLSNDAVISYITPKFYLLNKDDLTIRNWIMDKVNLIQLALCNPFDAVTENVITIATQSKPSSNIIHNCKHDAENSVFNMLPDVDKSYCKQNAFHEIILGNDFGIQNLLKKMSEGSTPLKDVSKSKRGAEVSKNFLRENSSGMKALIGADMKKYTISWNNTYLPNNHKEYSRLNSFFNPDLILLRRVDSCLEATISMDGSYAFNKNVYGININISCGYSSKFILGWMNSKAVDFYYKKKFSTKKDGAFPEIQTYLYEQLPIPSATNIQKQRLEDLVSNALNIKANDSEATIADIEKEIDLLIYHLYKLTYEEVVSIEDIEISKNDYESYLYK